MISAFSFSAIASAILPEPSSSSDNPRFEAHFKTFRQRPEPTGRLRSLRQAGACRRARFGSYDRRRQHGSIALMSPKTTRCKRDRTLRPRRTEVPAKACAAPPERLVRAMPEPPQPPGAAWINTPNCQAHVFAATRG